VKEDNNEKERLFEKVRFQYCVDLYKIEDEKQQRLEGKSQFYLSFITLFLGAVFLNLEFLVALPKLIYKVGNNNGLIIAIYCTLIILAVGIIVSVFSILQSVRVREHFNFYPEEITKALFSPTSEYLPEKNEAPMLRANAMSFAIAIEDKKNVNDRKAEWLQITAISVLVTVFSLVIFLATFFYLMVI